MRTGSSAPATGATGVRAEVSRSWLLVAAGADADFDSASLSPADQIILDLEDGVDPQEKEAARDRVVRWLHSGGSAWVRINDRSTSYWERDLQALRSAQRLRGIVLAKAESPTDVVETSAALGGSVPVIPLIESALGIEESVAIAKAEGAFRLAFGSGDYRRDTGASADDLAMAYPRSRLVVASRIGGLPGPIDGPTVSSSHPIIREQSAVAVALGMTGRLCLAPEQLPVVNEVVSPSPSDIVWADTFLREFEARGRVVRDGSDLPRLKRAEKIRNLALEFRNATLPFP